ncbi:MAG: LemA family protein [Planctomycetota bacterium]|nr:LemA family protein [Planctomycetota bacterium]
MIEFTAPTLLSLGIGAIVAIAVVGGIIVIAAIVIGMYNSLVKDRNRVKNGFAQIDVQLKRRHDLIPNLVETAKGYMAHEKGTLEAVTEARNHAMAAVKAASANPVGGGAVKALSSAEGALSGALGRLMVTMEAYPDLKASQNMMQVQEELTSTENKIAFARQAYNDSVMHYNVRREQFPSSIVAGMFNFAEADMFEIEDAAEKEVPKVSFN